MATFSSLRPRGRSFGFGDYQVTNETTSAGSVRFLHGSSSTNQPVRLRFIDLTQAEARLIRNHYRGQDGGHIPFQLSALAWAGHTDFNDLVPSTTRWRYASEPRETQKNGGFSDVTVELVAVI
jgi:hypothetical protein